MPDCVTECGEEACGCAVECTAAPEDCEEFGSMVDDGGCANSCNGCVLDWLFVHYSVCALGGIHI